jgi:hypothetical protein
MFSFIKWFEAKWQEIKGNKGLWFTLLTVFSLIGIFISLYFVNFLVSDVAKKTYENQKDHYLIESKVLLESYEKSVLTLATAIGLDTNIQMLFQSEDENKTDKLTMVAANYTQKFAEVRQSDDIFVHFTYIDKLVDTKIINGLKVNPDGVSITAALPLSEKGRVRFGIEVNQDIEVLRRHYNKEKKEFVILLDRGAVSQIDMTLQKSSFITLFDRYYVNHKKYNHEFIQDIAQADLKQMLKAGYVKDLNYFYVVKKAYDYDGQEIGLIIIGEKISDKNSFVNLIKNLVNSVTIVALGLIVSMILFLF